MKKYYAFLVLLGIGFAACTKNNDVAPDSSSRIAGTYQLTYIRQDSADVVDSLVLPYIVGGQTVISGTITATRIAGTTPTDSLAVSLTVQGQASTSPLGRVEVRTNGNSYDLYSGTDKVGTADGTNIEIDTDPANTQTFRLVLRGKK
ncbi:hypothetical protein HNV11_03545 [Spirosoma taeanense]|uniref:Lipocalin-like domain-containing protein n=1 Tax=Spirosoma taeanense TaxID=2735870 RepID=A0A6M5Y570_9BACT|nr:hypothetical protein [Spirosoma taeanense]QJW88510.1 hypothetical protein HNV11_03545 [Spirosoma taeanense]